MSNLAKNFTTSAINLKSYSFSESDKIIVMYSKDKGLIKGVAKGVKKPKSKLGARMDMFVANKLLLYKGKTLDTICQAESIDTFLSIRTDMDKLFYSMYCAEVVNNFGAENDNNSEDIFNLFYKTLEKLSKSANKVEILLNTMRFQLKMMHIVGYSIELENCVVCNETVEQENLHFSASLGGVVCKKCAVSTLKLHFKLRDFLNTLLELDFDTKTQYDEKATDKVCEVCFGLLKKYIEFYSPKKFQTNSIL